MSVVVSNINVITVPLGTPLAKVTDEGKLVIYPEGMGKGPMLHMDVRDWEQIKLSADNAIRAARKRLTELSLTELSNYAACEGHGEGL